MRWVSAFFISQCKNTQFLKHLIFYSSVIYIMYGKYIQSMYYKKKRKVA